MSYKYLFGSKLVKLDNANDTDLVTFVTEEAYQIKDNYSRSIPFFNGMIDRFIKGKNAKADPYKSLSMYQLSAKFRDDENYPFNHFNILEHKAVWIEQLKSYMNSENIEAKATKAEMLPKNFYHILYQYFMIKENTHFITDEAKINVQKIHDLEMPSSYFYELRDSINSL